MPRHTRLAISAAVVAAATALAPACAFGASAPTVHGATHPNSTNLFAKASSTAFKTFTATSPARLRHAASALKKADAAAGTTIYVGNVSQCIFGSGGDTGNGTSANPYCSIADAVAVAQPGDTISVADAGGYDYQGSVDITVPDLTVAGSGGRPLAAAVNTSSGKPAFIVDDVSGVSITGMDMEAFGAPAVEIVGSSGVTLDSDYVIESVGEGGSTDGVSIDGKSSGVTVSRTSLSQLSWAAGSTGISVAAGASDVDLATDIIADFDQGIAANGAASLDVVGDTIQRSCSGGILVGDASTGVSIENDLVEDANPNTDYDGGGYKSDCSEAWAPDITVSADSASGTTSDYNDFYSYGADDTAPYEWAGTTYPSVSAFQAAVPQGAHDLVDTKEARTIYSSPFDWGYVDAPLAPGSTAIGSANTKAPGALASDFYGLEPYTDRGAVAFSNDHLIARLSVAQSSALGVTASGAGSTGDQPISTYGFNWGDGTSSNSSTDTATHSYAKPGTYTVTETVTDASGDYTTASTAVVTAGSDFTPYGPVRLLDTRTGTGAAKAKVKPGGVVALQIAGVGSIPADATAVVLNVTVTDATGSGYITGYADGTAAPSTSNVNYTAGQTVPNLLVVPIGADGEVDLQDGGGKAGSVDLVADATGYFTQTAGSGYSPLATPYRLVDTRNVAIGGVKGPVAKNGSFNLKLAGADGGALPASGISAVALNITVTAPTGNGFIEAYPAGTSAPNTSNVNYSKGQTIANSAVVPVGSSGSITVLNGGAQAGTAQVIVDVVGYYSPGSASAYVPVAPTRIIDTRSQQIGPYGPLGNDEYIYAGLGTDQNGNDVPSITGYVLNATVTDTKGNGFLTVAPDPYTIAQYEYDGGDPGPITPPNASNLNWVKGATVPNLVQAGTGSTGVVDFFNLGQGGGDVDLIVDVFGFYQND